MKLNVNKAVQSDSLPQTDETQGVEDQVTDETQAPEGVDQVTDETQTPEVTEQVTEEQPIVEVAHRDVNPSQWSILPTEDGIEATNNSTGELFVGTIAEFNAKLRG